jgi:hypothetical protein
VATQRLTDFRLAPPADVTLRNLLGVLSTKLELCSMLPVYAWEAANEGHDERAKSFKKLAEDERAACNQVLEELRSHLQDHMKDKEVRT